MPPGERLVYVLPPSGSGSSTYREVTLHDLWQAIWHGRWLVWSVTGLFTLSALAYALLATPWYKADVLLAPAEERTTQGLLGPLGGLVDLAGTSVGGTSNVEAIATMRSRDFTRGFIEDLDLLTVLFADDWDLEMGQWRSGDPEKWPDLRDAVLYFDEQVRRVEEDRSTGLVTLSIEWKDPELAALWANIQVRRLNETMRQRALAEAEINVEYLRQELASTNIVTLQHAIGRLLEAELQKLMLAKGNDEFAFRIIDGAEVPKLHSKPRRLLVVILMTLLGGGLGVFIVLVRHAVSDPAGVGRTSPPTD